MNSGGKVLDWVLSFDDTPSISDFFQYAADRYDEFPDTQQSFVTKRFRSYPGRKMEEVADSGSTIEFPADHGSGHCPANRQLPVGTLQGKVTGRPVDAHGVPIEATLHQEQYMEATFEVSTTAQREFTAALRQAQEKPFAVPDSFAAAIVGPSYLGQLDVSPLQHVPTGSNKERWWTFSAQRVNSDTPAGPGQTVRIIGRSHIRGDGNQWDHAVSLDWQGFVEIEDNLVRHMIFLGKGREQLRWHVDNLDLKTRPASATLMGGHPIELDSGVVYGLHADSNSSK